MKTHLLAIAAAALSMTACEKEFPDIVHPSDAFTVKIYAHGVVINEYSLLKDSDEFKKLKSWFDRNRRGWKPSVTSYAPGILVSTGDTSTTYKSINFLQNGVIVNIPERGPFEKDIDDFDYKFLRRGTHNRVPVTDSESQPRVPHHRTYGSVSGGSD